GAYETIGEAGAPSRASRLECFGAGGEVAGGGHTCDVGITFAIDRDAISAIELPAAEIGRIYERSCAGKRGVELGHHNIKAACVDGLVRAIGYREVSCIGVSCNVNVLRLVQRDRVARTEIACA